MSQRGFLLLDQISQKTAELHAHTQRETAVERTRLQKFIDVINNLHEAKVKVQQRAEIQRPHLTQQNPRLDYSQHLE